MEGKDQERERELEKENERKRELNFAGMEEKQEQKYRNLQDSVEK